ncbi:Non functional Dihydropteroate synthase 2 [Pseudonocardia sp. Ae406_Ps2]|nr:Non functional Dihydropteroate synthase 2 [Pseudonocardia sp. Ae331_Ps2]OLM03774.1 Non functional Dihydropteroate synthase 2 [Pseudonocardia sp. Ae406_Ps2]OLM11371.1 Non functional Dihydropteroate synthase 2 [Pseudonocardia sp. Ae505_Ps2]OLM25332.1 Non functional Dihydropteroate synthase 2 [Pseudonocardia sp. Ae706_Ps2]
MTFRGRTWNRDRAMVMAIVNRTPDSFYDHGVTFAEQAARDRITAVVREGADVIDIGGVPASPGAEVTEQEEIDRVVPTVEWARHTFPDVAISVDTFRAGPADAVCAAGADLVNDNWAAADTGILDVAARYGAGYVSAHTDHVDPRTEPHRPRYTDVLRTVIDQTVALAEKAVAAGVPAGGILIDPAIDFSKNTLHSLQVLRGIDEMVATGWPVLLAMSNKTVVGESLAVPLEERLTGTLAATALAADRGVAMVRAHQARATRETCEMVATVRGERNPSRAVRLLA